MPILAHQELFKVPLHPLEPQQARRLRLHPLVHRLRPVPVHVRLAEHGEGNAVVAQAEGLDGVVVAGVLLHELVAGEAEDDEAVPVLRPDLLVQLLQRFELRGEAALGGRVDYQDDFVLEGGEGVGLAFFVERFEVVETGGGGHGAVFCTDCVYTRGKGGSEYAGGGGV